eukprot:8165785-Ditylum_brightwellii.AAC.1
MVAIPSLTSPKEASSGMAPQQSEIAMSKHKCVASSSCDWNCKGKVEVTITYEDEDGDMIAISTDELAERLLGAMEDKVL